MTAIIYESLTHTYQQYDYLSTFKAMSTQLYDLSLFQFHQEIKSSISMFRTTVKHEGIVTAYIVVATVTVWPR